MKTSQILKALPLMIIFQALICVNLWSKPILFRQAVDTEFPIGPLGHLMDLSGAWSLALSGSSRIDAEAQAVMANGVLPFSSNPDSLLHGYYLSPTYFQSESADKGTVQSLGNTGWQLMFGRGNLDFPNSTFRGFLSGGYRQSSLSKDTATKNNETTYSLSRTDEEKRSIIVSTGVSSTQNSLVSQKRPLIDSEILLNIRYDYEKGDLFTLVKAALFYPTWVDLGANVAWFKAYRESENPLYDQVSDDFIFGPRIRGRAWNHIGFDAALEWHAYRDFNTQVILSQPRASLSLIANF